jgi:hypothetical protein
VIANALDNLHSAKDKYSFLLSYADRVNKRVVPSAVSAKIEVQQ